MTLADVPNTAADETRENASTTIYVCTTCRKPGDADDAPRPGSALAAATVLAAENTVVPIISSITCA